MRNPTVAPLWMAATLSFFAFANGAGAQVLRELEPIQLKYVLFLDHDSTPVGEASASFRVEDGKRGRRLRVETVIHYTIGTPGVVYHEEVTLSCDEKGIEKFQTSRKFGDSDESYLGIRVGNEFRITATTNGKTKQKAEPADVRRSNLGLFCGGFLSERLDEGALIQDYPMLFPASGRHYARQKVQISTVTVRDLDGEGISVTHSELRKLGGRKDRIWNRADAHGALIRMEETSDFGTLTYALTEMNGRPVAGWAEAVVAGLPRRGTGGNP